MCTATILNFGLSAARFRGPLSVMDFVRWTSVTRLTEAEMREAFAIIDRGLEITDKAVI